MCWPTAASCAPGDKELALELEEGGYAGVLGSEFADQRAAAVAGA